MEMMICKGSFVVFVTSLIISTSVSQELIEIDQNQESGMIESPNFPDPYANNLNLTWRISTVPGYVISLDFFDFSLESSYDEVIGRCVYDYVKISDVEDSKTSEKEEENKTWKSSEDRFCGRRSDGSGFAPARSPYVSDTNIVEINFVTDYSNDEPGLHGFRLKFMKQDLDECKQVQEKLSAYVEDWDKILYCNHHCENSLGSYKCMCKPGYTLDDDQHTCKPECSVPKIVSGDTGSVSSDNYPFHYGKYVNCTWVIKAEPGETVTYQFNGDFDIEEHDTEDDCPYDQLIIRYGDKENIFCGSSLPLNGQILDTLEQEVTITFKSDRTVEGRGFHLTYTTKKHSCGNELVEAPQHGEAHGISNNGRYTPSVNTITFTCDSGYQIKGSASAVCQSNNQWSVKVPTCEKIRCDASSADAHSHTHLNPAAPTFNYGETVTIDCDEWWNLIVGYKTTEPKTWRCWDEGKWVSDEDASVTSDFLPACSPSCGSKTVIEENNLSNNRIVDTGEMWPWMVLITDDEYVTEKPVCSGSLISENVVLTAAHCVHQNLVLKNMKNINVLLGAQDISLTNYHDPNVQKIGIMSIEVNPLYVNNEAYWNNSKSNDMALLRLERSVNLTESIHPICLSNTVDIKQDLLDQATANHQPLEATLIGYGFQGAFISDRNLLVGTKVRVNEADECFKFLRNHQEQAYMIEDAKSGSVICGGYLESPPQTENLPERDACSGDSGGPLMLQSNDAWYLHGIVKSRSKQTCTADYSFSYFVDVLRHADWIQQQLKTWKGII